MSDYSFMRSGTRSTEPSNYGLSNDDIIQMVNLFVSNAMISGSRYSKLCERNGITREDMEYGLKYEVLTFFDNPNLIQDLNEIKNDMKALEEEEVEKYKIQYYDTMIGSTETIEQLFDSEESADEYIDTYLDDERYNDITLLELTKSDLEIESMIVSDNDIQPFSRIDNTKYSILSSENKKFIDSIHSIYDRWEHWEPEHPLQQKMKQLICDNKFF